MGTGAKRAGGAVIGRWRRMCKLKMDVSGVKVTRTVRGELVFVPAPHGSYLPPMLRLVPRPRGLFAAKDD